MPAHPAHDALRSSSFADFGRRLTPDTAFAERMQDRHRQFIEQFLHPVDPPRHGGEWDLVDALDANVVAAIEASGELQFHSVGDTGKGTHTAQESVATAMTADLDEEDRPGVGPSFFLHLGDVTYGPRKDPDLYRNQFYAPYANYRRKILAIPGNHDGDQYPDTDPVPLAAFVKNLCDSTPSAPEVDDWFDRLTMNAPGAYWRLSCPFLDVIGLYSNKLEKVGMIEGGRRQQGQPLDGRQKDFLKEKLVAIAAERAAGQRRGLLLAVHHPAYSGGGHVGSRDMQDDIDAACVEARVMPDLVLSAHSHNYQRFTRRIQFAGEDWRIPYIVAGGGGRGITQVAAPTGTTVGDVRFEQKDNGFGYVIVRAKAATLGLEYFSVDRQTVAARDSVTVDLASHRFI